MRKRKSYNSRPNHNISCIQDLCTGRVHAAIRERGFSLTLLLLVGWVIFLLLLIYPADVPAQMAGGSETAENVKFSFDAAPLHQFKSHMHGGGDVAITRYSFATNASVPLNKKVKLGFGLMYEFEDYNFSRPTGFVGPDPWNKIHRVGLGGQLAYRAGENWSLFVAPAAQYAGEQGADFDKSLMYGGTIGATYMASRNLVIGIGAGIFYRLEETAVFPTLIVSWKITDRLHLRNTFRTSPAGPAGLELGYILDKNWELSVGGGYRSFRFRLDKNGPLPNGIGQSNMVPVYACLTRNIGKNFNIDLYGGAAFSGKLRLEDRNGHRIDSVKYNTAPLAGFTLSALF